MWFAWTVNAERELMSGFWLLRSLHGARKSNQIRTVARNYARSKSRSPPSHTEIEGEIHWSQKSLVACSLARSHPATVDAGSGPISGSQKQSVSQNSNRSSQPVCRPCVSVQAYSPLCRFSADAADAWWGIYWIVTTQTHKTERFHFSHQASVTPGHCNNKACVSRRVSQQWFNRRLLGSAHEAAVKTVAGRGGFSENIPSTG